jgi:hypothetical protein
MTHQVTNVTAWSRFIGVRIIGVAVHSAMHTAVKLVFLLAAAGISIQLVLVALHVPQHKVASLSLLSNNLYRAQ